MPIALSMANGREGWLSLQTSNDYLIDVYEAYGFVEIEGYLPYSDMTLKPATSPKWQLVAADNPFDATIGMSYRLLPPLSYIGD